MHEFDIFEDYDLPNVYKKAQAEAVAINARNFVVDFGLGASRIASNVDLDGIEVLMTDQRASRSASTPTRWINIWAPNTQSKVVKAIGHRYGFSARLMAVLCTTPPVNVNKQTVDVDSSENVYLSSGIVEAERGIGIPHDNTLPATKLKSTNFYDIAKSFTSYQSVDIGDKFICIGANWMHPVSRDSKMTTDRLWSWLVLCNDDTVISFHEDPKSVEPGYVKAVRDHTLRVLSQLSKIGLKEADGVELISLRQPSAPENSAQRSGLEEASNLFYYLFDDWASTYVLLKIFQKSLDELSEKIMAGIGPRKKDPPAEEIIPGLYEIGKKLRSSQHLYRGYENLIARILEYKEGTASIYSPGNRPISVAQSACHRFERLRDNIRFLVLNYLDEAIGEKDGLHNTYFNITTQKDSSATAKLSSNATLLSKLGVLFLPVSLMTSYFSVQIDELQGVYTAKTYWVSFAVIMVLSFVALFTFSRVLVGLGGKLNAQLNAPIDRFQEWIISICSGRRKEAKQHR